MIGWTGISDRFLTGIGDRLHRNAHLALNRKNALFAGHDEGATAWGRIASLIETAKMNGVEPYAYLRATLEAIVAGHPASKIDELLPWAFTPDSP